MSEKCEIVYVLANEGMPNLIKIGKTKRKDLQSRMNELYTTGVPFPFECLWAGEVEDCSKVEQILHNAFRDHRVNPKREFFDIAPDQVIPLLQMISEKEITSVVTTALNKDVSKEEQDSAKKYKRPKMNFKEMGIEAGSVLEFVNNAEIKVTTQDNDKVLYEDKEIALTPLTKELLALPYNVQPSRYWLFNGKNLKDIYEDTYSNV